MSDDLVGISEGALARLVLHVVTELARQNLTPPPKLHGALVESLVAMDLDLDLSDLRPLRRKLA